MEFELTFEALTPAVEYGGRQAVVKAGGMEGYEQLCRVTGTVAGTPCNGVGQRGHSWGNPDWDKIALTRSVGAWFADGTGRRAEHRPVHEGVQPRRRGRAGARRSTREGALQIDEVRLSTTSDDEQRQIRAGLELYLTKDDDYPLRGVGEVVTGSTLELGALRLDVAFFSWHIDGRTAVGRYDILRHA